MNVTLVLTVVGSGMAFVGMWVGAGRLWAALYPIWRQRRSEAMLSERFAQGPYDRATIRQSTRFYIDPKCSNLDPGQEREIRHALAATREGLFDKVDFFLDHDGPSRHLLVLADSGTGKTSFILNYYAHNARRRKRHRHRLALVPLAIPDADELIGKLPDAQNTALFLDALDEDTRAIADHRARISQLMEMCRDFRRVVITCRSQFFPGEEEIPVETGVLRLGPRKAGEGAAYEFWKLYLSPFDNLDVARYLRLRYPLWRLGARKQAKKIALKIPLLSARPMLLAYIPDVVASEREVAHSYELYEIMIEAWLERETAWVNKRALREFSERLAVRVFTMREARGMERIAHEELAALARGWRIELRPWQIRGRSLLNRDAQGNYKFAHRSIMEYLLVSRLIRGDPACSNAILTDQMKRFLFEIICRSPAQMRDCMGLLSDVAITAEPVGAEEMTGREKIGPGEIALTDASGMADVSAACAHELKRALEFCRDKVHDETLTAFESSCADHFRETERKQKADGRRDFFGFMLRMMRKELFTTEPPPTRHAWLEQRDDAFQNRAVSELRMRTLVAHGISEDVQSFVDHFGMDFFLRFAEFNMYENLRLEPVFPGLAQFSLKFLAPETATARAPASGGAVGRQQEDDRTEGVEETESSIAG